MVKNQFVENANALYLLTKYCENINSSDLPLASRTKAMAVSPQILENCGSLGRIPPAQFAQKQRINSNAAANTNHQVLE